MGSMISIGFCINILSFTLYKNTELHHFFSGGKKVVERGRELWLLLFSGILTNSLAFVGEVVLLVNMPADSPAEEGQHLPDGRTATPTSTFSQQDINEGIVWYRHSGVPAQSDSFRFQVPFASWLFWCLNGLMKTITATYKQLGKFSVIA